ncbi:MAG: ABC transporter permease [Treponema sp.]|jgi:simple sugar transport system permease protein|nr:ABC transporter permease [Treponema sp.]
MGDGQKIRRGLVRRILGRKGSILSFLCVSVITIVVSALMILAVGSSIGDALAGFFRGIFGSPYNTGEVLVRAAPLILAGLGVAVGFRTGFTNLGAEGQIYMGAIAITSLGLAAPSLPAFIMIPLTILGGFLFGGIWSLIPGFLKARFGISEIINTIMFNYIAINLTGLLVRTLLKDPNYPYPMSPMLPPAAAFPVLLEPTRLHWGFPLALLAAWCIYILVFRSPRGFEMRAVGLNSRAALCAGISPYRNIVFSAFISGGLAGIAGVGEIAGLHHRLLEGISPSFGYVAIIVALLGRNHPAGVVISALGIAALQIGSKSMERTGVPTAIASVIMGLVVLLILARKRLFASLLALDNDGKGGKN